MWDCAWTMPPYADRNGDGRCQPEERCSIYNSLGRLCGYPGPRRRPGRTRGHLRFRRDGTGHGGTATPDPPIPGTEQYIKTKKPSGTPGGLFCLCKTRGRIVIYRKRWYHVSVAGTLREKSIAPGRSLFPANGAAGLFGKTLGKHRAAALAGEKKERWQERVKIE